MLSKCFLGLSLAFIASNGFGQLSVSLDENANFVLSGQKAELLGLDFISPSGSLVPARDAHPFQFFLSNRPGQVTFGAVQTAIDLDGELVLPVGMSSSVDNDIRIQYGTHTDSGVFFPTGSNPATWGGPLLLQQLVDGIFLELSHPDAGRAFNRGLATNQFAVRFHLADVDVSNEHDSSSIYAGVNEVAIGAWDLLDSFSYDGETAVFEVNGGQAEVFQDGTYVIPDGWLASESSFGEIEFTTGKISNSVATPEPNAIELAFLSFIAPFLLRRRREG